MTRIRNPFRRTSAIREQGSPVDWQAAAAQREKELKAALTTINNIRELAVIGLERGSHPEQIGYLNAMGRVIAVLMGDAAPDAWRKVTAPAAAEGDDHA